MRPESAEGRKRGIKHFRFNFDDKLTPNRPKAEDGGYYIFNLILMRNEPQIGRRPIKGDIKFFI